MKGNTFVLPKEKHLKKRNSLETKKINKTFFFFIFFLISPYNYNLFLIIIL
ncbi:hypothetical protein HMPREF9353_01560 [Treponema denticola F0402]|nr:hypothetical protein HMPREF9353_01560 [Treponema denticola F0402]